MLTAMNIITPKITERQLTMSKMKTVQFFDEQIEKF